MPNALERSTIGYTESAGEEESDCRAPVEVAAAAAWPLATLVRKENSGRNTSYMSSEGAGAAGEGQRASGCRLRKHCTPVDSTPEMTLAAPSCCTAMSSCRFMST